MRVKTVTRVLQSVKKVHQLCYNIMQIPVSSGKETRQNVNFVLRGSSQPWIYNSVIRSYTYQRSSFFLVHNGVIS